MKKNDQSKLWTILNEKNNNNSKLRRFLLIDNSKPKSLLFFLITGFVFSERVQEHVFKLYLTSIFQDILFFTFSKLMSFFPRLLTYSLCNIGEKTLPPLFIIEVAKNCKMFFFQLQHATEKVTCIPGFT